jgi:ribosomal protein S18 acetylase RimI-like enzyme
VTQPTIVGADRLAELAVLESVAEAVFGRGRREPGWFARKLIREAVDAKLSSLIVSAPAASEAITPDQIGGYALLGRAASLGSVARGSGVGIVASLRGRGLGRALLEHALARVHAAGCDAAEFLAEPERVGWYVAQGFAVVEEQLTLLALGTGGIAATLRADDPPRDPADALWWWVPEMWQRTPTAERVFVEFDGARFWLTREGRAWLVHRSEPNDPAVVVRGLEALRRNLAPTTPLLLYPCPAASPWVLALREVGFTPAQRSFVVRRSTAGQAQLGRRTSSS